MATALSPRKEMVVLPSLPPSPTLLEEELTRPTNGAWNEVQGLDEFELKASRVSPGSTGSHHGNGKGDMGEEDVEGEEEEEDDDETVDGHRAGAREVYPPMTDEATETRRVEETLKRWELAERQRRKSARESAQSTTAPSLSLISSVTRTASLVLTSRTPSQRTGTFKSHDAVDVAREGYAVPLDDIDHHIAAVAVHSPSASIYEQHGTSTSTSTPVPASENPFVHPDEARTPSPSRPTSPSLHPPISPFAESSVQSTPTTTKASENSPHARKPSTSFVPPPRPLGLPPPPSDDIPHTQPHTTPLQPTARPVLSPPPREDPEEQREMRWWHEWLCGCGEGPDRGGDNQAGRTNPFE